MHAEMALRNEGMKILISNLGPVAAERFISLIIREPLIIPNGKGAYLTRCL
jgi:hypothetical protein